MKNNNTILHKSISNNHKGHIPLYRSILFTLLPLFIFSCKAPKDVVYFQESENLEQIVSQNKLATTYKVNDIIGIKVAAPDAETALPFNPGSSTISSESTTQNTSVNSSRPTYLIDAEGMIEFPVLGELKVAGLTSVEVKQMIKEKLKAYINDPIVSVRLENFKVTILGEVNNPGPFNIANERITLLEAIGLAGDLGIKGKRTNITVIREQDDVQTVHKVDLTSKEIFNSPVYYLAQNDVVYVEPNESQVKTSKNNNWPRILTSVTSVLGIIISVIAITQ